MHEGNGLSVEQVRQVEEDAREDEAVCTQK